MNIYLPVAALIATHPGSGHGVGLRVGIATDLVRRRVERSSDVSNTWHSEAKICRALEQDARGYLLLGCNLKELTDALRSVYVGRIALGPLVATRIADRTQQRALIRRLQ